MTSADLAYRRTAASGASGIGLLISLYDTLASDLRRAADAERCNDIPRRGREIGHALLVIGHLEHALNQGTGGELARQLKTFYAELRRNLIQAQVRRSAVALEREMASVLKIREFWQKADLNSASSEPSILSPASQTSAGYPGLSSDRTRGSWSA
jgi:flagellar secretion chaperone FliS